MCCGWIETVEHEAELRKLNDLARVKAEIKAKAEMERDNRDVILEQIRVKAIERRRTILESIQWVGGGYRVYEINIFKVNIIFDNLFHSISFIVNPQKKQFWDK